MKVEAGYPQAETAPIARVLLWVEEQLMKSKLEENGPAPILVIDEANKLMRWGENDAAELREFLDFCIRVRYH